MKKFVALFVLVLSQVVLANDGVEVVDKSRSSTVTIYGKAANFLHRLTPGTLTFTGCSRSPGRPVRGRVECVLDVYDAKVTGYKKIQISGFAARELYRELDADPEVSGIDCFLKLVRRGENEVGCDLDGVIVSSEGIE